MKLILLGPPGAGKGTLALKAVELLNVPHIGTGVIFRAAMSSGSPLGLRIKAIVQSGKLVDNETTVELVKERLAQEDVQKGYILDGFPRTIPQAEALAQFSTVEKVVTINIADKDILERLGGRQVCRKCGYNFHVVYDKPEQEGICSHCGGELYARDDDKEETVLERLEIYRAETAPLINYYGDKGLLVSMDSCLKFEDTLENFKKALDL